MATKAPELSPEAASAASAAFAVCAHGGHISLTEFQKLVRELSTNSTLADEDLDLAFNFADEDTETKKLINERSFLHLLRCCNAGQVDEAGKKSMTSSKYQKKRDALKLELKRETVLAKLDSKWSNPTSPPKAPAASPASKGMKSPPP